MDEIKYSREWFVSKGGQSRIEAAKQAKPDWDGEDFLSSWTIDNSELLGSKADFNARYDAQKDGLNEITADNVFSLGHLVKTHGGVDAVFDLIDANGDGNITQDEINAIAAADTGEFDDEVNTEFSAADIYRIYNNALAAEGGTVDKKDNKEFYTFKDGTKSEVEYDSDGNVVSKKTQANLANKEVSTTTYDYVNKTKLKEITNAKGQIRYASIDAPGREHDVVVKTKYSNGKKEMVVTKTAGTVTTDKYNAEGKKVSSERKLSYTSDGVIDDTRQGSIGDCYVLAAVNALREMPEGKRIIKESIRQHEDGSVTVTLKGLNKSYTYTPDQIGAHDYKNYDKTYSNGDIDMNLIEMAIADYRQELIQSGSTLPQLSDATEKDPLNSGWLEDALEYLTGKTHSEALRDEDKAEEMLNSKQNNNDGVAVLTNFKYTETVGDVEIKTNHAYTVKKVTEDKVYIVNPHDSSNDIEYPREEFMRNTLYMASIDL